MRKKDLATALRKKQLDLGLAPAWVVKRLSDDLIVDSYMTCSDCGERFKSIGETEACIESATDVDHFLQLVFGEGTHPH
jgi:hypothetical protein